MKTRHAGTAAGLFLALALAYTYPTVTRLQSATPVLGLNYTLMAHTVFIGEQLGQLSLPVLVERIFYPVGYSIHEGLVPSLMAFLLGGWADPLLGINLSLLASFLLASLGAYLLAFEVTESHSGAFIAGFYFGFCTQHYAHLSTYPIFHLEWLPWYFWALFRSGGGKRLLWLPLTGLFFALASLSSWYFSAFLLLATAIFGLSELVWNLANWRLLACTAAVLLLTFALLVPFTPPFLIGSAGVESGGLRFSVDGSADLLSLILPSEDHWLFGSRVSEIQKSWLGNPSLRANFLGYASLMLALIGIPAALQRKNRAVGAFLIASVLLFTLLALGPFLVIDGLPDWKPGQPIDSITNLKLPYYWLSDVFPFSSIRATSRFSIMTVLALSLLLAFGCRSIERRLSLEAARPLLALALLAAVACELWIAKPPMLQPVPVSGFHQKLAQEEGGHSLLQLPFQINGYRLPYYSASHNLNVIGGAVDKPFRRFARQLRNYPFFRQVSLLGTPIEKMERFHDVFQNPIEELIPGALSLLDVRYAVVHKNDEYILSFGDYFEPSRRAADSIRWIGPWFEPVYEDYLVTAFRRRKGPKAWICPIVGSQWGEAEQHTDHVNRPLLGQKGDLEIHASQSGSLDLSFELTNVYRAERSARLSWNGSDLQSFQLITRIEKGTWHPLGLEGLSLRPGRNVLTIASQEPALSGKDVYGRGDRRRISFLLRRVSLEASWEPMGSGREVGRISE